MAASSKQIANRVRTVTAFAVIKEFRRSKIIENIVKSAQANGHIATGDLISPESSNSIVPFRDDLWLTPRKGVKQIIKVRVYQTKFGMPSTINVTVNLGDYGIHKRYSALSKEQVPVHNRNQDYSSFDKGDMIERIIHWMEYKMDRGHRFYYSVKKGETKVLSQGDEIYKPTAAFAIMRSLASKGPDKTNFAKAFNDSRYGVQATLRRAIPIVEDRIFESISMSAVNHIETIF